MKLTKTKKIETITEEIEVNDGIYYFSYGYKNEEPYEFYKVIIENEVYDQVNLKITKVRNSYDDYLVSFKEEITDYLGALIEEYFKGEWKQDELEIKEISSEEFETNKILILNKMIKL
jgi:hypothetical protein